VEDTTHTLITAIVVTITAYMLQLITFTKAFTITTTIRAVVAHYTSLEQNCC
jgi:hypothetical protein